MATNQKYNHGDQFSVPAAAVAAPSSPGSGDAVLVGELPAVALTDVYDTHDGDELITVKTNGVYHLEVDADDGAIGVGDRIYIDPAAGSLTNDGTGNVAYGYALGPVDSAATSTIPVKLHA